ncbi:MAG TPA: histidine phosphatase family protein [Acidimicrobiia bacterium]|nr:histidine phosphatase family protein [Acidimicrobiia bacterium]
MVEIWLARHGESTANIEGVWQGQSDAALSPRGEEQAKLLGARLSGHSFDLVVASDLERTTATAALAGLSAEPASALRELDLGRWEGLTSAEVMARYPEEMRALMAGEDVPIGGGETWRGFCARVDSAVEAVVARLRDGRRALVVTHGGLIGAYLSGLLRYRARSRPWPVEHPHNTALTVIVAEGADRRVRVLNDATHLGGGPPAGASDTVVGLARHGESEANRHDVWHGVTDGPLSARGLEQGAELAARYDSVEHVYTSHLQRARLTAAAFIGGREMEPLVRSDLYEIDFGAWEGLTTAEIKERFPDEWVATHEGGLDLPRGKTGETVAGAAARLRRALEEIAAAHAGQRVLVFTHGGLIRACVGSVIGLGPETRVLLDGPANASVTHLRVGERGTVVVDYNLGGV